MTIGGKLGCTAAVLIFIIVSVPILFGLAWSGAHCEPVPQCQQGGELHFGTLLLGVAVLAGIVGFLIRCTVNALALKRDDEGNSVAFVAGGVAGTLVVTALAIGLSIAILGQISG